MPESKIETIKGNCVIALTKFIMSKLAITQDKAFSKLNSMEIFGLLNDTGTNLFLETNEYLCKACELELNGKTDEMYKFIQNN